jgi:hypothetical protein
MFETRKKAEFLKKNKLQKISQKAIGVERGSEPLSFLNRNFLFSNENSSK